MKNAGTIYNAIIEAGKNHHLIHAGAHAMDIMRMEKMYLHWGHDISPEENPYQAGLGFVVNTKMNNFVKTFGQLKIDRLLSAIERTFVRDKFSL